MPRSKFLQHVRQEFLEDLAQSFGKSDTFSPDLKALLFDLWVRARDRPLFPRPEPTEAQKQAEFEERLSTTLKGIETRTGSREAFTHALQKCVAVGEGIIRNDREDRLSLHLDATKTSAYNPDDFAQRLHKHLAIPGGSVALEGTTVELSMPGSHLPPGGWRPVFQSPGGALAGFDDIRPLYPRKVNTYLCYNEHTCSWRFPNPPPIHTPDCSHIRVWVDGVEPQPTELTWGPGVYDSSLWMDTVQEVTILSAADISSVKASYPTVTTEPE